MSRAGTYGRRVASESREVFGIDVSMGMLRQGVAYVSEEAIPNMHFAPKSGGASGRRQLLRRRSVLRLASPICGYLDCLARYGSCYVCGQ